ncbi:ORF122 [Alphabaculovirus altermyunipunctae]|jgi:hypothetical protein|uniref:ORF122 n=1 Tax=Mythimna unipuncta nucleopolyhedrovirus TaxID=447897 RepID=A0A346TPQ8_9ABAC|nr:ORF122 [Mythimna unipuncta nucleopolyhedrovirus]AXU41568.1 ORF122 [Mythimna unipuncta nucleopolyhedrovirus]
MQANITSARYINRDLDMIRREHGYIKNEVRDIKNHLYDICRQSLSVDNALCNKIKQSPMITNTSNSPAGHVNQRNANVIVSSNTNARNPRTMDPSLPDGSDFSCSAGNTKVVRSYNVESVIKQ